MDDADCRSTARISRRCNGFRGARPLPVAAKTIRDRVSVGDDRLLTPGQTCWRVARADQVACIIDAADYFLHVKVAMLRARHRIMLIGWDFDARTTFERGIKTIPGPNQLSAFLY